ncbi:MAG: TRAP transporter substrate-binding protein [Xanthobacteraceae bacterium]|uniref:TRAP transporter substrate-binding protein n=1 Tax=Pseudolabrys sp. TaxID=1960880 RepID=UPI003D1196CF
MTTTWKRPPTVMTAASILTALLVASPIAFGSAAAKELTVATFLPPTHPTTKLYEQIGKEIAEDSKGDLTFKVYAGGTLGAGPFQQYQRAVEGVADIVDICHAFHAKVFSRTMLIVLPGSSTSAVDATTRLWDNEKLLEPDYKQVKNLFMYSVTQAVLTSRESPVKTMADLKGKKVFIPGAAFAPTISAWGGTPVPMALEEMYNALSTGVVDVVALPAVSLGPPFRLGEVAKYSSVGVSGLFNPCGAIMNKKSYASLTPSQKAILDKHTGRAMSLRAAKIFDGWAAASMKGAQEKNGLQRIDLTPEVRNSLREAAKPVVDKTIASLEQAGVKDARAVYDAMNK